MHLRDEGVSSKQYNFQSVPRTLTNCTTVRNFSSPLEIAIASGVGSILVPLSLAINFNRCRQLGAWMCSGGDFPNGRVIMLGIAPWSGVIMVEIAGAVKPNANVSKSVREYISTSVQLLTYSLQKLTFYERVRIETLRRLSY